MSAEFVAQVARAQVARASATGGYCIIARHVCGFRVQDLEFVV
jgi:hypothetical protein